MFNISSMLNGLAYPVKTNSRRSWRSDYLDEIVAHINKEREGKFYMKGDKRVKCRPVSPREIAWRTAHLKTEHDLHFLLSICKDSERRGQTFSKAFFGSLKGKI